MQKCIEKSKSSNNINIEMGESNNNILTEQNANNEGNNPSLVLQKNNTLEPQIFCQSLINLHLIYRYIRSNWFKKNLFNKCNYE